MFNKAEVIARLKALGNTVNEVAESLRAAGIRGCPRRCTACPIAMWAQQELGASYVIVQPDRIYLKFQGPGAIEMLLYDAEVPRAIFNFILAFDGRRAGKYRFLWRDYLTA